MDYDVAIHNARVFADGGTVPDNVTTDRYVRLLKQAGLWDSCVFFADTARGVKKDGNEYVSKVYDLKANADLLQATGTAQPKYNTDGSLLYDGTGDFLQSSASLLPKLNANPDCTIAMWCYWNNPDWSTNFPATFRLNTGIGANQSIAITFNAGKPAYDIYGSRVISNSALLVKMWYFVLVTKVSGSLTTENTKIYANNVELSASSTEGTPNLAGGIVTIGMLDNSASRRWTGYIGETFMFNKVLNATERQFLFDMTKPQYGV